MTGLWQPGEQLPPVSVLSNFNGRFHFPNGTVSAINMAFGLPWNWWHSRQLRPFSLLLTWT